jgi:hypothetical protein
MKVWNTNGDIYIWSCKDNKLTEGKLYELQGSKGNYSHTLFKVKMEGEEEKKIKKISEGHRMV